MEIFENPVDFILHIDKYFDLLIQNYGAFIYVILFLIIFAETGLVFTPFLPGDSLIFIAGTFAARGSIDIFLLFFLLSAAAIIGDSINYYVGKYVGEKISQGNKLIKKEYLERTQEFYKKHGGKTIILARFIPIIRTFAPFVAGLGKMNYTRFLGFNVFGGIIWVGMFAFGGYYFGQLPFVQENLTFIILFIIFLSVLPVIIEYLRKKRSKKK